MSIYRNTLLLLQSVAGPSRLGPSLFRPSCTTIPTLPTRGVTSTIICLSGHNRWSKIRHKKGAADLERATLFSRLLQEMHTALKPPNSHDPDLNPRLADAVAKAREKGVTKATIEGIFARARSIADGTGQSMVYEAMGPGGKEALMIECVATNPKRALAFIRDILHKHAWRLAPVSFMFEKKGVIVLTPKPESDKQFDDVFDLALEYGAEDVQEGESEDGKEWEIHVSPPLLSNLAAQLSTPPHDNNYIIRSSELSFIPQDPLIVSDEGGLDEERAEAMIKVVDQLEEDQHVVKVWTNLAE